ncbi:MAG: GNAT family N-acetyltransferase [Candidatus Omnitrophica bacterium]|nr:GNAT family N-acetyltransferase [Candidatus Omnitrophota bacterium]
MEIRPFHQGDNDEVVNLVVSIMKAEFPRDEKAFPIDDLKNITASYGGKSERFFVATSGREIVGTVGVKREDGRTAMLRRIFVKPSHRRQKIGLTLIRKAIDFCRENGYETVVFKTTSRMSRAIQLCERNGFREKARIDLGGVELLKFSYSIAGNNVAASSK